MEVEGSWGGGEEGDGKHQVVMLLIELVQKGCDLGLIGVQKGQALR